MIAGKTLLDYYNLFSCNEYKKNDKIVYKFLKTNMTKENACHGLKLNNRSNEKLNFRRNKTKWFDKGKA